MSESAGVGAGALDARIMTEEGRKEQDFAVSAVAYAQREVEAQVAAVAAADARIAKAEARLADARVAKDFHLGELAKAEAELAVRQAAVNGGN